MICYQPRRATSTRRSDLTGPLLRHSGNDVGKKLRGACTSYLRGDRRSGRCPDDQIGLRHIHPGVEQAGDDADQPRISFRSAAAEHQCSFAHAVRRYVLRLRHGSILTTDAAVGLKNERGAHFFEA